MAQFTSERSPLSNTDLQTELRPTRLGKIWLALRGYRRGLIVLLIPLSLALTSLAHAYPAAAERLYARGVYPLLTGLFGRIFGLFPFSLAEILLYLLVAGALGYLGVQFYRFIRRPNPGKRLLKLLANIGCVAGAGYFVFTAICGLNYHRLSFAEQRGYNLRPSSVMELAALYAELVDTANACRPQMAEDESGVMTFSPSTPYDLARQAPDVMKQLALEYDMLGGYTPRPKPVLASRGMSALDITGVYIPFTFEANVNVDVPHYNIPFTMMHELAHFKGFMREDEANFIAYLACRETGDATFNYSGTMLALLYTGNALYGVDKELYYEINAFLDEGILRDFSANSAYWKQFEGPVAEIASAVNDVYLKTNRQEEGVRSYGRMVDLLLADYRLRHSLE